MITEETLPFLAASSLDKSDNVKRVDKVDKGISHIAEVLEI